ncbi:MAG: methyl-accepting chemotaxis protein [Desulfomonile tiedjei]|nr:methyl-accepting chemotaxis protein [Desulfomonile tiedjei]
MSGLVTSSLMRRLVVVFMAIALAPIAIVGYLSDSTARSALYDAEFRKLNELREEKSAQVRDYLAGMVDAARFLADYDLVLQVLASSAPGAQPGEAPDENQPSPGKELGESQSTVGLTRILTKYIQLRGQYEAQEDVLVIRRDGQVMVTVNWLADCGADLKKGDLRESGLGKLWERVMATQKPAIIDFGLYQPAGSPAAFVGVPVFLRMSDQIAGVLAIRFGPDRLNKILRVTEAAGNTAEAYLVGTDGLMRTQSTFTGTDSFLKQKVTTAPAEAALHGQNGCTVAANYRGLRVFSSYGEAGIRTKPELGAAFEWAVLAEIDENEAIQPAVRIAHRFGLIGAVIVLVVALAALFLARSISRPITTIAEQVNQVSAGDLTVKVAFQGRADEIGRLAQAVEVMVKRGREQIGGIVEGVRVLTVCAAEISATVAQLASNTSMTSSAITETTTTVEQVKQAARLSNEEARKVADTALQSVAVSEVGGRATEETMDKMNLIHEQMESIGATVVRLSEHRQAIEGLIETVRDLADQSNLLAVNASIEAARAGDRGKGFAVVAHEIKCLADQSSGATAEVRRVLEDNRRWVSSVVMAAEQGTKAVELGVRQSELAAGSIRALSVSVSESSQAATVISSSVAQQFVGVDQVADAMTNIEQAVQQTLAGTIQLEGSARKLEELGGALQELVQRYTV